MTLAKQAKIFTEVQQEAVLALLASTCYPACDRVIFLLSVTAGMRAKEVDALNWELLTDAKGELADMIAVMNVAAKARRGGRAIPIAKELKAALVALSAEGANDYRNGLYFRTSERGLPTSSYAIVNKFAGLHRALDFTGASSHSGRRTAITNWARKVFVVDGSLCDVQILAGLSALSTTELHIEANVSAMKRVVEFN